MEKQERRVVVIDDDIDFCRIIRIVATREFGPLHMDTVTTLAELGDLADLGRYDLVILDYYLEDMVAEDVCHYIEMSFPHLPVVLISGETYICKEDMKAPRCVRSFVSKACGVRNILQTSLGFINDRQELSRQQKRMSL